MRFISKMVYGLRHPIRSAFYVIARMSPRLLFWNYSRLARQQGFRRPYFILSFDCDTVQDIAVVEQVHARLMKSGIIPVYAVPGQLLEQGREVYQRIAASGAEFINHGYSEHCRFDVGTQAYISSFFYDQLPLSSVREDILRGHQAHIDILGKRPVGFRVPHFGTFQARKHLNFLFEELQKLHYRYSTSTVPLFGFKHGPLKKVGDSFYEIPVSGCFDYPLAILDSWGFRFAPGRQLDETDYVEQFAKISHELRTNGGLLNIYADPSQIHDWDKFYECVESMAEFSIKSYIDLLGETGK